MLYGFVTIATMASMFATGYLVARTDPTGTPRAQIDAWLVRARLLPPPAEQFPSATPSPELEATFKPFWEAWTYVNREFYDENAVDTTKLSRGALRGMISTLDDPYSLYLDPLHRELSEADLRGAFDGIGVQVEMVDDRLTVVAPLDGSSGQRAGLQPADVITHVDGRETKGLNLAEAIRLIRGPRGTSVVLTLQRATRSFDVTVAREEVRVTAVRGETRPDGISYIRISNFTQRVGAELRQTIERLPERRRGLVLDLRGNPGGYLEGAIAVTSLFLEDKVVLYEQRRGDEREEIRTRGRSAGVTGPMVVLVDKGTASASEIVAAALRDHGRATLVGEQTFGKGLVQLVHPLSDGSAMRLTVARWLTPAGDPIQGVGLTPGIVVEATASSDLALQTAVNHLLDQPTTLSAQANPAPTPPQRAEESSVGDRAAMLDSRERQAVGRGGLV